jgi:hypothetical protein
VKRTATTQPRPDWVDVGSPKQRYVTARRDIAMGPMDPDDVVEPELEEEVKDNVEASAGQRRKPDR